MNTSERTWLNELKDIPVFSMLEEKELSKINGLLAIKNLSKGELLFEEEESPRFMFFVRQGELKVTLVDDTIRMLGPGELLGEIGLLHGEFRTGIVHATTDTELISICGTRLFEEQHVPSSVSLKIVRELAKRSIRFFQNVEQSSSLSLIANSENDHVEFKSTLRANLHTNEFDKRVELAAMKTIAAFLNSIGGTLLIGVDDAGTVVGLASDRFPNEDKMMLHLMSLIKDSMGELNLQFVKTKMVEINGNSVLRVDCRPATSPVYVNWQNEEKFYVRSGPSTVSLNISSVHGYIRGRFPE